MKIRHKIFCLFMVLSLITLSLISIPTYFFLERRITENSHIYSENTAAQVKTSILLLTNLLENSISEQIKRTVFISPVKIEELLLNLLYPFIGFEEVHFLSDNGEKHSKMSEYERTNESPHPIYRFLDDNQEMIYDYWGEGLWFSHPSSPENIYIAMAVYLNYTIEPIGILVCGVPVRYVEDFYYGYDALRGGNIFVYNREKQLVYANKQDFSDSFFKQLRTALENGNTESGIGSVAGSTYLTTWISFRDNRLHIAHVTPLDELFGDVERIRFFMVFIAFLTLVSAFAVSYYFSLSLTNRLSVLVERIHYIERGHREAWVVDLGRDEIGELGAAFKSMTESLENTVSRLAHQEVKAIKAEYAALQSQVNPHFLFNVLESINSMAKLKGEKDISRTVSLLAGLFRKNIRVGGDEFTLKEEVDYIRDYLHLYQSLLGGRFSVEWDTDMRLMMIKIPKFLLQPLIENAIKHGLEQIKDGGLIMISIQLSQDHRFILLEVSDNGAGMDTVKLGKLRGEIDRDYSTERHIGLAGTHKRLKLLYGNSAQLEVNSTLGIGTSVIIRIPLKQRGFE